MKILQKLLFVICLTAVTTSFIIIYENNNPMVTEQINLRDNEIYPKLASDEYFFHESPYKWTGDIERNSWFDRKPYEIEISNTDIELGEPILLKSMSTNDVSFKDLKENCLSVLKRLDFPVLYERSGDNFMANEFTDAIFNSKVARQALFNYALRNFKRIEHKYPNSWKQNLLDKVDECLLFTKTYNAKRVKYLKLHDMRGYTINPHIQMESGSNGFAYKIGYYQSFIFRRIEYNNIPIQEINSYLMICKSALLNSITNNGLTNYKTVYINNGELIISDSIVNGKGIILNVRNKQSTKTLTFNSFSHIKCFVEDEKNFYVIYQNGKTTLINASLDILNTNAINKSNDMDLIQAKYAPIGEIEVADTNIKNNSNKVILKKKNGVYYVPVKVNGINMEFIFDTGASDVSISLTEALFLFKNGKLAKSDILGKQYFTDATGSISSGTKIIIRDLQIGKKTIHNIEATIVNNKNAPLLIGQSALQKLGKIIFDPKEQYISFE